MKLKKIIALFSLIMLLGAVSCIKDRAVTSFLNQKSASPNTIDFNNQLESVVLNISPTPFIYTIYVELNSTNKSNPAVDVTIQKDALDVTAAGYEFLPDSCYQLLNTTATVDPSTNFAAFNIKIFSIKVDLTHAYAVGFKIVSGTNGVVIASNKTYDVVVVGVKNIYDGIYSMKGETLRAGDAGRTGHFAPIERGLITFGAYANDYSDLQVWADGTGVGIGIPRITIDPLTNLLTISSPGGATNFPGYNNHYDPATRTFYVGFTWGGGPSSRFAFDTLTYLRPR